LHRLAESARENVAIRVTVVEVIRVAGAFITGVTGLTCVFAAAGLAVRDINVIVVTIAGVVEASPRDRVWGIGLAAGDERAGSPERWQGLNLPGFALMEVRHQLGASR
jgi:hypothetical protein